MPFGVVVIFLKSFIVPLKYFNGSLGFCLIFNILQRLTGFLWVIKVKASRVVICVTAIFWGLANAETLSNDVELNKPNDENILFINQMPRSKMSDNSNENISSSIDSSTPSKCNNAAKSEGVIQNRTDDVIELPGDGIVDSYLNSKNKCEQHNIK